MESQKYYCLPCETSSRVKLSCALIGVEEMKEIMAMWNMVKRLPAGFYVGRWERLALFIEQGDYAAKLKPGQTIHLSDEEFWELTEVHQEDATVDVTPEGRVNITAWDQMNEEYWLSFELGRLV